jgi:hypothetical protein
MKKESMVINFFLLSVSPDEVIFWHQWLNALRLTTEIEILFKPGNVMGGMLINLN